MLSEFGSETHGIRFRLTVLQHLFGPFRYGGWGTRHSARNVPANPGWATHSLQCGSRYVLGAKRRLASTSGEVRWLSWRGQWWGRGIRCWRWVGGWSSDGATSADRSGSFPGGNIISITCWRRSGVAVFLCIWRVSFLYSRTSALGGDSAVVF